MKKVDISRFCAWKIFGKYTPTNMQSLKMTNTNMTIFAYLGSETLQSFGNQIYLYQIMQVLATDSGLSSSDSLLNSDICTL